MKSVRPVERVQPPGGAPIVDGDLTAFPTATNPTQQVVIAAPVAGDYVVQVRGVNVTARSAATGAPAGNVQDFARKQPTAFLGAAVLIGFAAVRFLKSGTGATAAASSPSPSRGGVPTAGM